MSDETPEGFGRWQLKEAVSRQRVFYLKIIRIEIMSAAMRT